MALTIETAADAFDFEIVKNTRAKSDIWRYFGLKKRKLDQQIEEHVAVCRECHATVRCTGGGTSNLSTHVRRHHPSATITASACDTSTIPSSFPKREPNSWKSQGNMTQPTLDFMVADTRKYPKDSKRAAEITHRIARFIIKDLRPYRIVDTPEFRDMLRTLDPRYHAPSRKQFSEIIIPKLYAEIKFQVIQDLRTAEQVSNRAYVLILMNPVTVTCKGRQSKQINCQCVAYDSNTGSWVFFITETNIN